VGWLGGVFVCRKYCRFALVEGDIQPQVEGPGGTAPFKGQEPCQENAKPAVDAPQWGNGWVRARSGQTTPSASGGDDEAPTRDGCGGCRRGSCGGASSSLVLRWHHAKTAVAYNGDAL